MSGQLPEGHAQLRDGDYCPLCNAGILHRIAETADGVLLKCFNCDRSGSVHKARGYQVSTGDPALGLTPSGFTQTPEQLAASASSDPEQAMLRSREQEPSQTQPAGTGSNQLQTPPPDGQEA